MKRIVALLLFASMASAQPTYDLTTDVNYPDRKLKPLTFLQGATPEMRVYVEQNGATYTNIGSDSMVFSYGTSANAAGFVMVTNSAVDTANAYFTVNLTAANLNTNGSFWYTAMLKDSGGGMYYSGDGSLEIKKTTVTGSPGSLTLSTPLDWDGFVYSSPEDAPMIVGTNLLASTNASGQVTVSAAPIGDSITITAGDGITVTTNADDRAIAVNSTVLRDSTLAGTNKFYVSKAGSDSNTGRSPFDPFLTIGAGALAATVNRAGGGAVGEVNIEPGSYTEDVTISNGVFLVGSPNRRSTILGTLTLDDGMLGGGAKNIALFSVGSVDRLLTVPAGMSETHEIVFDNVTFGCIAATNVIADPINIAGGRIRFENSICTLPMSSFGTDTTAWNFMMMTNGPKVSINNTRFSAGSLSANDMDIDFVRSFNTNILRVSDCDFEIDTTGVYSGEVRCVRAELPGEDLSIKRTTFNIVGDDETAGEGEAVVAKGTTELRAEHCDIKITGFLKNYSYETYDTAHINVNMAGDVNALYQEAVPNSVHYTGSPEDGMMQWEAARFGLEGEVRTDWPLPSDVSGHNGIAYVAFGQASEIVSGESVTYNNMITADDGDSIALTDSASSYMNLTMSITNWSRTDNDGENAAGTLFPQKAVRGNIENTANGSTGVVVFVGASVGETYVFEVLGSAAGPSKPCDDMTYWMDNSNTQTVDVVNNTDTLALITNVATSGTMYLYCKEANGNDPYLNAFRMTGPSASGYVRTDGESVMTGDLNGGGQDCTNFLDMSIAGNLGVSSNVTAVDVSVLDGTGTVTTIVAPLRVVSGDGYTAEFLGEDSAFAGFMSSCRESSCKVYQQLYNIANDDAWTMMINGATDAWQLRDGNASSGTVAIEVNDSEDVSIPNGDLTVAGDISQTSTTNTLTKQWYAASNRWAYVQTTPTVTNIIFITP